MDYLGVLVIVRVCVCHFMSVYFILDLLWIHFASSKALDFFWARPQARCGNQLHPASEPCGRVNQSTRRTQHIRCFSFCIGENFPPKQLPSLTKGVATWCMHGTLDELVANTTLRLGRIPEHMEAVQKLPNISQLKLLPLPDLSTRVPNWRVPSHIEPLANAPVPPPVKLLSKK